MNLRQILLTIAISSGLTLATVGHAQNWHSRHMRTPTSAPADTTAPTTPTGLAASALTSTSLTLSWNASTDNVAVTGYNVYCNGTLLFPSTSTSVSITDLLAGRTCAFTIAAFDAAGNVSAPSAPLSVTTPSVAAAPVPPAPAPAPTPAPVPAPAPQVLWSASMETGDLSQWNDQTNSGSAISTAVTAFSAGIPPKSGNWVMKQSVTGSAGGTRMARFPEIDTLAKAGTTFYVSWWDYYPTKISFGPADMFGIWQLASFDANGIPQPVWGVFLNGTDGTLILGWSPAGNAPAEGPHAGEFTSRRAYTSTLAVPVGQWVFFEVMIKPAADFTGAFKLWMNGTVIFDQSLVKTRFPDTALGGFQYCTHNAYGSGLTPTPASHYVDNVTISLGRMPYP